MTSAQRKHRTYPVLLPKEAGLARPQARRRPPNPVAKGLAILVLLGAPLLGHVWLESQAAQAGYRLRALRQEVAQLERERQALRSREAALRAPDRLERVAARLGLRPPSPEQLAAAVIPADLATRPAAAPAQTWWQRIARVLGDAAASAAEPERP